MIARLAFVLGLCVLLSGCGHTSYTQAYGPASLPNGGRKTTDADALLAKAQHFINTGVEAQKSDASNATLLAHFDAGVALSNDLVNQWFAWLDATTSRVAHDKGLINVVGNAATGVLGLTGAEAKHLALLGIGLAGVNSEIQNYMAVYLISPAIAQIQEKLNEGRAAYLMTLRAALANPSAHLTYGRVREAIEEYHNLASRQRIAQVVAESIHATTYTPIDPQADANKQKKSALLGEMYETLHDKVGRLSEEAAKALYVEYYAEAAGGAADAEKDPVLKPHIAAFKDLQTKAADKTSPAADRFKKLLSQLEQVGPLVGGPQAVAAKGGGNIRHNNLAAPAAETRAETLTIEEALARKPVIRPKT